MHKSLLDRFRVVAIFEGISYLALLFIAMPLKYMAGMPQAVKYTGWVHGILFITYCYLLFRLWTSYKWPLKKAAGIFVASLLPFAPFIVEKRLKKEEDTLS